MAVLAESTAAEVAPLDVLELEITGACQLSCSPCFAESGPSGTHGTMTVQDWRRLIVDAAALGVPCVQLIGGEPMMHPGWAELTWQALDCGLSVEIFSNLYHVKHHWWSVLATEGVSLGTSYYSDNAAEHDRVTHRKGSHKRTRDNIVKAVRLGIPLRAGVLEVFDGQRVREAVADLESLGVTNIRTDKVRGVGRGAAAGVVPDVSQLCGACGRGRAAVSPTGALSPCVLSRFLPVGNVRAEPLAGLLSGSAWAEAVRQVPERGATACQPDGSDCNPADTPACNPAYDDILTPAASLAAPDGGA